MDEFKRASNASPESEARGATFAIDRKPLPKVDRLDYGMTMGPIVSIPLGGGLLCLLLTAIRAIEASPTIVEQPQSQNVGIGETARLR